MASKSTVKRTKALIPVHTPVPVAEEVVVEQKEEPEMAKFALTFGDASVQLRAGKRIARAGWNDKSLYLVLNPPVAGLGEYILMKSPEGKSFLWGPNQLDVLANDWFWSLPEEV